MSFVKKNIEKDKNKMMITKGEMSRHIDPQKNIVIEDMIMGKSPNPFDQKNNQIPDKHPGHGYTITEQAIKREHDNSFYGMASNLRTLLDREPSTAHTLVKHNEEWFIRLHHRKANTGWIRLYYYPNGEMTWIFELETKRTPPEPALVSP